jgi:hypothetical protein
MRCEAYSMCGVESYKIVEMYMNYRTNVPIEYHSNVMYAEPSDEVWLKVKVEKTERLEFYANLKAKKYVGKEQIENVAFGDGEAKM